MGVFHIIYSFAINGQHDSTNFVQTCLLMRSYNNNNNSQWETTTMHETRRWKTIFLRSLCDRQDKGLNLWQPLQHYYNLWFIPIKDNCKILCYQLYLGFENCMLFIWNISLQWKILYLKAYIHVNLQVSLFKSWFIVWNK